jgi:subtilisin-like proprotein convertase family protein
LFTVSFNRSNAQVSSYSFTTGTGATLDAMSGSTQLVAAGSDDDVSAVTNIGFTFSFNSTNYTQFSVNANGLLRLGGTVVSTAWTNSASNANTNSPAIMPYWDDLSTGSLSGGGKVHYKITGTAPNRILIIEWFVTIPWSSGTPAAKFQCWLYETTNVVRFLYGSGVAANSSGYTIGIATSSTAYNTVTTSSNTNSTSTFVTNNTGAITSGRFYNFTPPSCSAPAGITATNLAPTTATISWNAASPAPSGGYNYEVRTSGAAGSGATGLAASGSTAAGVLTANISGLTANSAYTVFLRSNCGGGTLSSWSSGAAFTTPCNPSVAPTAVEGFSTYVPSCWFEANGALAAPSTITPGSNEWTQTANSFANVAGTSNRGVKYNLYGTTTGAWLISQPIDLGSTPSLFKLRYKIAVTSYNGTTAQATLGTHVVRVIISTDGGTTWTSANTLRTYTGSGNYSNTGQVEGIDLVGYSGVVRFAFVAVTSSTSPDIDFHIDDFEIVSNPPCAIPSAQPTALTFSGTTVAGTNVAFTAASGSPSGYLVVRTTSSSAPSNPVDGTVYSVGASALSGTIVSASSATSFTQSSLSPSTQYYFWVYSYNDNCLGAPVYRTATPLSGSITTNACSISGVKSVGGTGADYATLTEAISALRNNGLAGPVQLSITGTYTSTVETFPIVIPQLACINSTNTLTIKPAEGATPTISGSSASTIFLLDGADFVTIDGSNTSLSNSQCPPVTPSRDLTIINTSTASSAVIWLQWNTPTNVNSAQNNTIKNCVINGAGPGQTFAAIGSGSSTYSPLTLGNQNNNNRFINNSISRVQVGIISSGGSATNKNSGTIIQQNIMTSASPNNIGVGGIYLEHEDGALIAGNSISNISLSTSNDAFGIIAGFGDMVLGSGAAVSTSATGNFNSVSNLTINANNIGSVKQTSTYSSVGIALGGTSTGTTTITNNMISGVMSNGTAGDFAAGLLVAAGSASATVNVFNNTVAMQGAIEGSTAASQVSTALAVTGSTSVPLNIHNNILSNTQVGNTGATLRFTAVSLGASSFTNLISNNNILYSAGAGPGTYGVGQTGGLSSGTMRTTLSNWQTATSNDANSLSGPLAFTSATNLRLSTTEGANWIAESKGVALSSVTTDIDCDLRSANTPDIGADEFTASSFVVTNPAAVCAPNTVDITAAAVTAGTTSGTTFTYWTNAAGTITLTTPAAVATSGTYYIKATYGSADNYWIKPVVVVVNPLPTPTIVGDAAVCATSTGNVYSVTNVTGNTYAWTVTGGTIIAGQGTNSITVTAGAAGTATVTVTETVTATGCVSTVSRAVTVNAIPSPVITGQVACTTTEGNIFSVANVTGNTYAWSVAGGTVTAGAGTNAITVTWGAVGAGTVTVTQTITATGCATTVSRAIDIQTLPTATAVVVEPLTCASEDGQINLTLGGAAGPYTFAWTGTGNGLSPTTQDQTVVSTGFYNVVVTAANGCTTSLSNIVVAGPGGCFICPTIGTISSTATIICQDGANTITASGLADLGVTYGIRFKYSATPLANPYLSTAGTVMGTVTNANLANNGASASVTYNFPTAGTMYVYAILSPSSPDPACRPFLMIPVEVAPTPVLTDPANQALCTGSTTTAVSFVATPAATTSFAWTNNRTSIGLAASGAGNSIGAFTATNFTNAPVTATVTVTPTNTQTLGAATVACPGPAQTYTYTVNPIPTVNTVTNQQICAGTTVSLPFSGFAAGTVFEWTNSSTAIGLAASGAGTLSFTATNTTSSPITATIVVTPKFTNAGVTCSGNPISFDITVNPKPVVDAIPAQVLCSGSATTALSLTSATTGTAFSWTNSATSIGLAGTGTGTSIASFTAVNTGAAPVNAIITVTPSYTGAGFTCTGTAGTTTITVNPIPTATAISNSVICNGAATTYALTSSATAATYNWTNSNTDIGLAGTGSGTIAFTASNTTAAPISSTITVTPSVTNGGLTCTGGTISFTVTVNPSGQVNAIDNQVLCNGSATSAVTFSTTNNGLISTGGTQVASSGTISIAVPDNTPAGVTHAIPVTLPTGAVITNMRVTLNLTHTFIGDMVINLRAPNGQVLNLFNEHGGAGVNLLNTVISSTGTASLASGTAPFTGTYAATAAIGVGPTGNASTAANFASLYSIPNGNWTLALLDVFTFDVGTLTGWSISFDYTVQGQFGTNMNWTNSLASIGLAATGTGNIPSFTAANTTAAPVTSTVTVTPVYFNSGTSCPGTPATFTYTVNPTPTVSAVANQVFCAGSPSTVNFSGATTGTVFNWTSSNAAIGLAVSGSGNLSFTPTNTSNVPIVSTIIVTPSYTNAGVTCTGTPRTFTITVNPVGQVNTVLSQVLCNGAATTAVNFATINGGGTVQVGTPVTANSGAITVAIPDNSPAGVTHSLPVTLPAGATITGISVNFNITHTFTQDVVINLRAPNGQILNLVNRRGGAGDNFVNTNISSASTNSLAGVLAPFTGTYAADAATGVGPTSFVSTATNFAALYSVANGDWTLGLRDYAPLDLGTLTGWSITFNYTTVAAAVTTYNWTNTTPSIGLAASGVGNIASFAAANTSTVPVTATVSVIPTYTNAGVACAGPASSFTYTVNPTPTVAAVSSQAVCVGSNVAAVAFAGTVSGTVYNWTNTNAAIGLLVSGTGDIASFVATNTTSAPISGTVTVTPVFTNAGITCSGTPRTFTITVNPIPTVNPVASFPVCHNSTAAVTFSGATTGTVYSWTNSNTAIGLAASGTGNISFTALNTTGAPVVATITVTPRFTSGGTTCTGTPRTFTITVNPLPVVSAGTLPARICISDTLVPLNGTPVGGSWSGIGTSGMNFVPTATAVGTWPITYTFSDLNGCTNRATIAATVLACEERDRDLDNRAVFLYPNPNNGQFFLRINSTRFNALGMRVFNTAGQLVSTKQWSGLVFARVIPVDLSNLPGGVYMVRLYYGDGMDRGADRTFQIIVTR